MKTFLHQVRQIRTSTLYGEGSLAETLKKHRNLLRAIETRDGDRAERLARAQRRTALYLRREMTLEKLRNGRADGVV